MIALVINCSSFDFRSVWNHVEVESADFISWKVFNLGIKYVIRKFVLTFDSHFWSLILKVLDFRAKYIVISSGNQMTSMNAVSKSVRLKKLLNF